MKENLLAGRHYATEEDEEGAGDEEADEEGAAEGTEEGAGADGGVAGGSGSGGLRPMSETKEGSSRATMKRWKD